MQNGERLQGSEEGLLDKHEVAEFLAVSLRTLATLREKRVIPFIRIGGAIRYKRAAITEALDRLTVQPRVRKTRLCRREEAPALTHAIA